MGISGKIVRFVKKEIVLIASFAAALISCFFAPVVNYTEYIDTDTIMLLFSLMAITAGFSANGVLGKISSALTKRSGSQRFVAGAVIITSFFTSMLITNDVALIAFVPVTLLIFNKSPQLPYIVTVQTIAANMGSMLTPVGNPQNLYLYSFYNMSLREFLSATFPVSLLSLILVALMLIPIKKESVESGESENSDLSNRPYLVVYGMLFVIVILTVLKIVTPMIAFISVLLVLFIMQPEIFAEIDYCLLLTFACFFIFTGNIRSIPVIYDAMRSIVDGHEFAVSLALSQIISNVPSAAMMSAFTDNGKAVLLGTDAGGLGTLIASLASLISFRLYSAGKENRSSGKYILTFTLLNIITLAIVASFIYLFML